MPGLLSLFTERSPYKGQARYTALLWTLLIFVACLWPGRELPRSDIPFVDKWVHFILFAPFTFLWLCAFPSRRLPRLLTVLSLGCGAGLLVELLQLAFPALGRSFDLADIAADAVGSGLGILLFFLFSSFAGRRA